MDGFNLVTNWICSEKRFHQTKAKLSDEQISKLKPTYLSQIEGMVKAHNIPSELVINWDQAGVKVVPSQNWTMEQQGACRVEIAYQ